MILMILIVAGTFGFMYIMKKKINTQYAHMRAGQLAPRLGMQLTEGNPEFNLATQSVQPSVQNMGSAKGLLGDIVTTQIGGTLGEFKLQMIGEPYGSRAELILYCKQDFTPGYTTSTTTTWHDLRLTIHARCAAAPFDLRLRKEMAGLEVKRRDDEQRMPVQSFGDPALDQRYVIEAIDPALPSRIASALGTLSPYLAYVHVKCAGDQVSFVMTPASVMAVAASLEQILHVLASIAAIVEGRPVPGTMLAPPVVMARA